MAPYALGANALLVNRKHGCLVAERNGNVEQNRIKIVEVGGLAQAANSLIQLFGQCAPAVWESVGLGSLKNCRHTRFHLGLDLLLKVFDKARKILFANFPPVSGRRGGGHSLLSVNILTERKGIHAALDT